MHFLAPEIAKNIAARTWTKISCTVSSAEVEKQENRASTDRVDRYRAKIGYRYTMDGKTYHSNRYTFLNPFVTDYGAEMRKIRKYVPGQPATCFVNPSDYREAVLERGFPSINFIIMIPGVIVALGLWGLLRSVRNTL